MDLNDESHQDVLHCFHSMSRESQPVRSSLIVAESLDGVPDVAELVRTWYPHDESPDPLEQADTTSSSLILPTTEQAQLILPSGEVIYIEVDPPAATP